MSGDRDLPVPGVCLDFRTLGTCLMTALEIGRILANRTQFKRFFHTNRNGAFYGRFRVGDRNRDDESGPDPGLDQCRYDRVIFSSIIGGLPNRSGIFKDDLIILNEDEPVCCGPGISPGGPIGINIKWFRGGLFRMRNGHYH